MYKEFFGLKEEPFSITPDPRFLYLTEQHREALNHVLYGIRQRKGFITLTGEVGTGKTTLCRAVLRELGPQYRTALILNPALDSTEMIHAVLEEFGVADLADLAESPNRLGYLRQLNKFLLRVNSKGQDAVLIVDEVQDMPDETLEMIRLLSNLETERQKLLQIVLVGQPEFRERLRCPSLRQLNQRITVRFHLKRMDQTDTADYLRHRLQVAGADDWPAFDRKALREIYRYSSGTPRLINALGDKSLLAGYVYQTGRINRKMVRLAARELNGVWR